MSQTIHPNYAEAAIAPATVLEKDDFRDFLIEAPDNPEAILELFLNPPDFNDALLRAKEARNQLFRKAS